MPYRSRRTASRPKPSRRRVARKGGARAGPPPGFSHQLFRALLDGADAHVFARGSNGRYLLVNAAGARQVGRPPEQIVGRHVSDVMSPEEARRVLASDQVVLESGGPLRYGIALGFGGQPRSFAVTKQPLRDNSGRTVGVIGIARDVTSEAETARSLRLTRERLDGLLAQTNLRIRSVLENIPDGVFLKDVEGRYVMINQAAARLLGRTVEEMLGRTDEALFPSDIAASIREADRRILSTGRPEQAERDHPVAAGRRILQTTKSPVRDEAGRIVGVLGVSRDITERKIAEERLRESEEFHRTVIDNLAEGVMVIDRKGRVLTWNATALTLLGHSPETLRSARVDDPAWDPVREDGSPMPRGEFPLHRVLDTGQPLTGLVWGVRRADGDRIWLSGNVRPLFRAGEAKPYAVVSSFTDVTERRRMEEALRRSEAPYRGIVEGEQELICRHTPDGVLTFVNESYARYFGRSPEELIGRSWLELVPETHVAASRARMEELLKKGSVPPTLNPAIDAKGQVRTLLWQGHVVRDARGEITEMQAVGRDVTEEINVTEELRRSRQELRALASRLEQIREDERTRIAREIHDELGQSLTALRMDLQWLLRRLEPEVGRAPRRRRPLGRAEMRRRLTLASQLTDDTLKRVRQIAAELRPGVLDHVGLAAAIDWEARQFAARTGIPCRVEASVPERPVEREPATNVFRICQEALTNVARHARARSVAIRLHGDGSTLRLLVEDDGIGIGDEALRGTGSLGLVGMRERAMGLGGELVVGRRPEGGTRVSLSVPWGIMSPAEAP